MPWRHPQLGTFSLAFWLSVCPSCHMPGLHPVASPSAQLSRPCRPCSAQPLSIGSQTGCRGPVPYPLWQEGGGRMWCPLGGATWHIRPLPRAKWSRLPGRGCGSSTGGFPSHPAASEGEDSTRVLGFGLTRKAPCVASRLQPLFCTGGPAQMLSPGVPSHLCGHHLTHKQLCPRSPQNTRRPAASCPFSSD